MIDTFHPTRTIRAILTRIVLVGDLNVSKEFVPPKESIARGEYAPIIRREDQLEQHSIFNAQLVCARWGLVPNEYCSIRDADRFGLHAIRFERLKFSRVLTNIYPSRRCVIPTTGLFLDGVDNLEPGKPRWLAGIWTRFSRPMLRVESFSVFTQLTQTGREAVVLEGDQVNRWLEPTTSSRELKAIAEGWWTLETFPRQIKPESRLEARVQYEESEFMEANVPDLMPIAREKPRFVPGDRVQTPDRHIGEVLEVQPK